MKSRRRDVWHIVVAAIALAAAGAAGEREREKVAWVTVCRGDPEVAATYRAMYESAAGAKTTLMVSESQPAAAAGCASVHVPVAASAIAWARLIPAATAKRLGAGLLLQGEKDGGPSPDSEIIPLDDGQSTFSGSAITFHGRIEVLRAMLPDLERTFAAAHPAFGGIALHELPDVDPGRRKPFRVISPHPL